MVPGRPRPGRLPGPLLQVALLGEEGNCLCLSFLEWVYASAGLLLLIHLSDWYHFGGPWLGKDVGLVEGDPEAAVRCYYAFQVLLVAALLLLLASVHVGWARALVTSLLVAALACWFALFVLRCMAAAQMGDSSGMIFADVLVKLMVDVFVALALAVSGIIYVSCEFEGW